MTAKEIRAVARVKLKGHYALAIAVSLVLGISAATQAILGDFPFVIGGILPLSEGELLSAERTLKMLPFMLIALAVVALVKILFVMPIEYGTVKWFFKLVSGSYAALYLLFSVFKKKDYARTVKFIALLYWHRLKWRLLFALPAIILAAATLIMSLLGKCDAEVYTANMIAAVSIYTIFNLLCELVLTRYFADYYIFCAGGDDITGSRAIHLSTVLMKGRKGELIGLVFSYFGWFALAVASMGLTLILTVPQYNISLAIFAKNALDETFARKLE